MFWSLLPQASRAATEHCGASHRTGTNMRIATAILVPLLVAAVSLAGWGAQMRQVAIVDLPGEPGFDQVAFANGMLVVAHQSTGTLDIFDPGRRRVVGEVKGLESPHGLAVNPRAGKLYVANTGAKNVAIVSTRDWKIESSIPLPAAPYDVTLSSDGSRLYLANRRELSISAVDLAQIDRVQTVNVAGSPAQLAFDPARRVLYATLQDRAAVVVLDPNLKELARYKLLASQPTGLILDTAAHRLYVSVRNAVLALDAATGTELGRVAAPEGADSMWLDTSEGMLYVASSGGFVTMVRTGAGKFIAADEIRTDVRGHSLAYDPARRLIYMPGGREGRSKLLILRNVAPVENQAVQEVATKK